MLEGGEYREKFSRPRFRSYQPVIRELFRRGDMDGVMKLWKHMQWHNILPKVPSPVGCAILRYPSHVGVCGFS